MPHDPAALDSKLHELTRRSVAQRLLRVARQLDERALQRIRELPGAPPVRPAHTRLFPHLDFAGTRTTELAERLGVSKQAVSKLVGDLVDWGVVQRVPDPSDGRATLVRFTPAGLASLGHGLQVLDSFEAEVRQRVGDQRADDFAEVLDVWLQVLAQPS